VISSYGRDSRRYMYKFYRLHNHTLNQYAETRALSRIHALSVFDSTDYVEVFGWEDLDKLENRKRKEELNLYGTEENV